jgi:hypothetical protein
MRRVSLTDCDDTGIENPDFIMWFTRRNMLVYEHFFYSYRRNNVTSL